jgi:enoyl-CoA hydratase
MDLQNVIVSFSESVALVIINRPEKLNALNGATISELSLIMSELEKNNDVRVIILTGAGEKAFVAGADISEFSKFSCEEGKKLSKLGHDSLFNLIERLSKPVIAAINGFALGGGLELAMSCHIRIASESAKLGLPEVTLGLIPGYGGTQRLPRLVGRGKALEMILSAQTITAQDALKWGLVNDVATQIELIEASKKIAEKIAKNSPCAITAAIKSINAGYLNFQNGFDAEINEFGNCFQTQDFIEGTTAFIEKRKPNFNGN